MGGNMERVRSASIHARLVEILEGLRADDGGFPTSLGGVSEVESTAVAALALSDRQGRGWLAEHQQSHGGFRLADGRLDGPSNGALAALALEDPANAREALAYAISNRGRVPTDARESKRRVGWGWTSEARSLVEPTARILIAVNALTPGDDHIREEALTVLRERQCADGGWNYGNASQLDVDLRGYAQTTAIALVALQGESRSLVTSGLGFLRRTWRAEPGGLTAAHALLAFRLQGAETEASRARTAIGAMTRRPAFAEKPVTVAWAALATGPDALLEPLRSRT